MNKQQLKLISNVSVIFAAILLCYSSIEMSNNPAQFPVLRQPSSETSDLFNDLLKKLQLIIAPMEKALPPNAPLRYLSETEVHNEFEFVQAVVAPRRIGPHIDSAYLLVLYMNEAWLSNQKELHNIRPFLQLSRNIRLYRKD